MTLSSSPSTPTIFTALTGFNRRFSSLTHKRLLLAAELLIIIGFGIYNTRYYANFDPALVLNGPEMEWVTVSGQWAYQGMHEFGYLPQWQPYINRGQPAIEEPVGFILNPFSILPSLMFGVANGIKVSIIFYFLFAGVGGWFLGKVLGWSAIPRLTLGLLLIVKGNMQSVIGAGYFQLGTVQAYFPWVLAAAFAVVRFRTKRWPLVMFALMTALVLFAGNLYYILPVVIMAGIVFLPYLIDVQRQPHQRLTIKLDRIVLRRILQVGVLTFGISAVYFLPVFINREFIGAHPNYAYSGIINPLGRLLHQYFVSEMLAPPNTWVETTYSYVSPLWFAGLLIIIMPIILINLHIRLRIDNKRAWLIGLAGFVLFTLWAFEPNPLLTWVYETVPVLGQWRVPTRMLAVSAFFLIFILALRLHNLWQSAQQSAVEKRQKRATAAYLFVGVILAAASVIAIAEVTVTRVQFSYLTPQIPAFDTCLEWLHTTYPDKQLSLWTRDNYIIWSFPRYQVRLTHINGDYDQLGMPPTLYEHDLSNAAAEYILLTTAGDVGYWNEQGYEIVSDSPPYYHGEPCLLRNPNALSYAFSVALDELIAAPDPFPTNITTPIQAVDRIPEHIWLQAMPSADEEIVVVAQDIAYPGWIVQVNGEPAKLESVGQLLGVVLPPGDTPQQIEFIYTAPTLRIGGFITLISAFFCMGYLLELDHLPQRIAQRNRKARKSDDEILIPAPIQPVPQLASSSVQPAPIQFASDQNAQASVTPIHVEPSAVNPTNVTDIHAEATADFVRIVLPPNDKPYQLVVVYPTRQARATSLIAFATASIALLWLLVIQRPRKK